MTTTSLDLDDKKVIKAGSLEHEEEEEEEYSRPSSSADQEVDIRNEPRSTGFVDEERCSRDKEAQPDARSTRTTESTIPPPPDGGLHAWLKVFGGFMIYINIWCVYVKLVLGVDVDSLLQGLHTHVWCFPIVLQDDTAIFIVAVCNLMDRYRAGMATHCYRGHVRPTV